MPWNGSLAGAGSQALLSAVFSQPPATTVIGACGWDVGKLSSKLACLLFPEVFQPVALLCKAFSG